MSIQLHQVEIGYLKGKHKTPVLSQIDKQLQAGELTCLLGANGVGKSTLLRTLAGFQPKLAGKIHIQGKEIDTYTPKSLAKVISIVLTQRPKVYNMSSFELVATGRTPYTDFWGKLTAEDHAIIRQAFQEVGIEQLKDRYIDTLSDGERQKVMIAKALVQDTPIILLDEPTAFLDYPSKVEIMQLLAQLAHQNNKTILLSTHDMELAFQVADYIWLFNKDKQLITGTPEDLAIDGHFNTFFKHSGVSFNAQKGLFMVHHPQTKKVWLKKGGQYQELIERALARNGIEICKNQRTGLTQIEVVDEPVFAIEITFKDQSKQFAHSIKELLAYKNNF